MSVSVLLVLDYYQVEERERRAKYGDLFLLLRINVNEYGKKEEEEEVHYNIICIEKDLELLYSYIVEMKAAISISFCSL